MKRLFFFKEKDNKKLKKWKNIIKAGERQATEWEKTQYIDPPRDLATGRHKPVLQISKKKADDLIFLQVEERLEHALHKRVVPVADRSMTRCSAPPLVIREMPSKPH